MTVDVEDYFHVGAFASVIERAHWDKYELRVERNTQQLLELFAGHGVQGTFFVLGWVAARLPGLIRQIAAAGHEVACHGETHELVFSQDPGTFLQQTITAKQRLEDITGMPVLGYRAASYSITHNSLWALEILADLGFVYDSSVFPIKHDVYGIADAPRGPYRVADDRLTELPLTTVQAGQLRLPCAGGGYFRLLPYAFTRWAFRRVNRRDRMAGIFYLHPWEIDPDQPRIPGAGWRSRFRHYTNLGVCEQRLKRLLADFSWGRVDDVFGFRA